MTESRREVSQLLQLWQQGDHAARDELFDVVHHNMHVIARSMLKNDRQRQVLQATELVNECVLRLLGLNDLQWRDRAHFIGVAGNTMRRILVDEARRRGAAKRSAVEITLATHHLDNGDRPVDIIALDDALNHLDEVSPDLARVVELKYFGGLTNEEVAEVAGMSTSSVKRSWRTARAWLYEELTRH